MLQLNSPYTVDGWEDVCVPANVTDKIWSLEKRSSDR